MERIRNIQQNLWQTKLFITHEKESINKLQEDLKGPTNKINKLAWVINHKWRSLRTKKANPKELSDVDRYSQSLDKSRFFDARDRIGDETDKYAAFLKYLRDKSNLVAVIFLTDSSTKRRQPEELPELIHSLFSALFGFGILPNDEKRIVRVIGDIAKIQIAEYQGPISSFFLRQTALSLSFRLYIEWSVNTRVYIGELMSDIVINVLAEPEFLIVDEAKFQERYPNITNLQTVKSKVDYYRKRIASHVISMVTQIRRHLHSFPPYLRWLGVSIVHYFQTYRGASQDDINIFLGELFFTRMMFYPFLQPQIYLSSKLEVVDLTRHNLYQVTHTFREAFLTELGVPSSSSRQKYATVLPYIGTHTSEMVLLLEELVDVPYSSTVIPTIDIPVHRSAVLITERDLFYIINLLMEVLASGKFHPEEKEMLATALSMLPSEPCRHLSKRLPGSRRSSQQTDKINPKSKSKTTGSPEDNIYEEEILVFSLPDLTSDKLMVESKVLGTREKEEPVFDERRMSVLLTTEHPLNPPDNSAAQEHIKGRLLQDFDLLFHNPSLEIQSSYTPDGISLSSATSYDSLERHPDAVSIDNVVLSSLVEHGDTSLQTNEQLFEQDGGEIVTDLPKDSTMTGDSTLAGDEVMNAEEASGSAVVEEPLQSEDHLSTESEEVRTPVVDETGNSVTFDMDSNFSGHALGDSLGTAPRPTLQRVNMSPGGRGFFYEPSDTESNAGSLLRNSSYSTLSRFASDSGSTGVPESLHTEHPIDIINSEFVYQNQNARLDINEDKILKNAINKLKIAFALFPHFYKSYYPKIGSSAPPTTIDLISLSPNSGTTALVVDDELTSEHKQLLEYLHSEYTDATIHNGKNAVNVEQAIIALKQLPPKLLPSVLSKLEDYNAQQGEYIQYLMERKCELIRTKEYLSRMQTALEIKHDFFYQTLASFVIQSFLKGLEEQSKFYRHRHKETLMADEKSEVYVEYIDYVCERMYEDESLQSLVINHNGCDERECASNECTAMENHRNEVMRYAEIGFFNAVFYSAFLPNGEAQKQRDNVFKENLSELQVAATLNHPDILIPAKYHNEAPWLPAQRHLVMLPAFRSPSGKLSCIMNCVFTIFKLLFVGASGQTILDGKTDDSSVPGADDLLPVLIYVIIHANPPNIFSTIDFIDNFTPRGITGQDQYMLMQFRGAVEFIKSMLHKNPQT